MKKETEKLPLKENIRNLKKERRKSVRSIFFLLAVVAVFAILGFAWFANNSGVTATRLQIAAQEAPFYLATQQGDSGKYDSLLETITSLVDKKQKTVSTVVEKGGKTLKVSRVYNVTGEGQMEMDISGESNLNNENASSVNTGIQPGSSGKLTFYLIPNQEGLSQVTFQIIKKAYRITEKTENSQKTEGLEEVAESPVKNQLVGHILLFDEYGEAGYDGWLKENEDFTVKASDYGSLTSFQKNTAYEVTIYWIWPRKISNIVTPADDGDKTVADDYLFSVSGSKNAGAYEAITKDIKQNPQYYFYGYTLSNLNNTDANDFDFKNFDFQSMSASQYSYLSAWYNDGDFCLGENVDYLYLEFHTTE